MLERHVQERGPRLGEHLVAVADLRCDPEASSPLARDLGLHEQLGVDVDGPAVAHEDPSRHGRKAVPGREQPAGLVERGRDEPAVDEPRASLMALVEGKPRFVLRQALAGRAWKPDPGGRTAATPAGGVVVRRDYPDVCHTFSKVPNRSSCT